MGKRIKKHYILGISAIVAVAAYLVFYSLSARKERDIIGCWVSDSAGIEKGFQCATDGTAAPVCNPDKQYSSWYIDGKKLILKGKQFNNYTIIPFSDTLLIRQISKTALTVEQNGMQHQYHKIR